VNDIAEDKKVPALLTLLGGKTYTLHFHTGTGSDCEIGNVPQLQLALASNGL
jgi:hypothetical protein